MYICRPFFYISFSVRNDSAAVLFENYCLLKSTWLMSFLCLQRNSELYPADNCINNEWENLIDFLKQLNYIYTKKKDVTTVYLVYVFTCLYYFVLLQSINKDILFRSLFWVNGNCMIHLYSIILSYISNCVSYLALENKTGMNSSKS
jgi:hypothetical protein